MDETIKDIVADLRARAARAEAAVGFPTVEAENDRRLAARIEAAAKREHSRDASEKAGDIADILRDMRAREMELWEGKPPRLGAGAAALMLDAFIDRLEAAAAKEATAGKSAPAGDAAAMREALAKKRGAILRDSGMGPTTALHAEIDALTQAALAEPPRNCDILSEEEANEAWDEYRHSHVLPRGGWDFRHVIAWLFAKAEGGAS